MRRINFCWAAVRHRHPKRIRSMIRRGRQARKRHYSSARQSRPLSALDVEEPTVDVVHREAITLMAHLEAVVAHGSVAHASGSRSRSSPHHSPDRRRSAEQIRPAHPQPGIRAGVARRAAVRAPAPDSPGARHWRSAHSDGCDGSHSGSTCSRKRRMNSSAPSVIVLWRVCPLAR